MAENDVTVLSTSVGGTSPVIVTSMDGLVAAGDVLVPELLVGKRSALT